MAQGSGSSAAGAERGFAAWLFGTAVGAALAELDDGRIPTLDELRADLSAARAETLRVFSTKDDDWLAQPMAEGWANHHWAWFHVMEDEVSHRGQIRLLRRVVAPEAT